MRVSYYLANRYTRPWAENSYKLLSLLIAKKPVFWAWGRRLRADFSAPRRGWQIEIPD